MSTEVALIEGPATNGDSSQEAVRSCQPRLVYLLGHRGGWPVCNCNYRPPATNGDSSQDGVISLSPPPKRISSTAACRNVSSHDNFGCCYSNVSSRARGMTSLHDSARCEHDWVGFCRKCYVARIARPAPRLRARGLFGPCDLARRLPTAASIGQIPVPPCCLGVLLAVVLPAVCLFSRILPC
jgi:hypothetical protein